MKILPKWPWYYWLAFAMAIVVGSVGASLAMKPDPKIPAVTTPTTTTTTVNHSQVPIDPALWCDSTYMKNHTWHACLTYAQTNLPKGVKVRCPIKIMGYLIPYYRCRILIQPGSTFDLQQRLLFYEPVTTAFVAALIGFACAAGTKNLLVALGCATVAPLIITLIKNAFTTAVAEGRCVQLTFGMLLVGPPVFWPGISPWGKPQQWLWKQVNGPYGLYPVRYWGNPDDCQTRNDPTPLPGYVYA